MNFRPQWFLILLPLPVLFLLNVGLTYWWNLYDVYPWIDIPMHTLGGAAVAWTFAAGMSALGELRGKQYRISMVHLLLSVVLVASVWEVYEYIHDLYSPITFFGGTYDTIGDMIFGLLGGLLVSSFVLKRKHAPEPTSKPQS